MDELLKALAEAVRQGSALAMPALVGYYGVRIAEAVMVPVGFIGVALIASRTVLAGMTIYHNKGVALCEAQCAARRSWLDAHAQGYRGE